jgi:hypothetical protein
MALWSKLRNELDRAGRVAEGVIDEGRVRLEAFRARQLADRAAQALGYAVYRARKDGGELDADTYARLSGALAGHEEEAARLDAKLAEIGNTRKASAGGVTVSATVNQPSASAGEAGGSAGAAETASARESGEFGAENPSPS